MTDKNSEARIRPHIVDLSTGKPGRKKVTAGMDAPVVQKTINLSTEKEKTKENEASASERSQKRPSKAKEASGKKKQPGGASLAELLDPETLAKLKGDGGN